MSMLAELENAGDERLPNAWADNALEKLREMSRLAAGEPDVAAYLRARLEGYTGRALMKVARLTRWQYRRCRRQLAAILEHPPRYNEGAYP
jgi:hypothetical protein